jgi:predicted nucleic acid-binding protein
MSGVKYILDTNALISFFQGNAALGFLTSAPVGISVISILEFLSFPAIDETAKSFLFAFAEEVEVFNLNKDDRKLMETVSSLRIKYKIKLPDAIIADSAINSKAILITNDKDFSKIPPLKTATF